MKLILKALILGACASGAAQAMDLSQELNPFARRAPAQASESDLDAPIDVPAELIDAPLVKPISTDNILAFKEFLLKKDDTRFRYQLLVGAVGAGVASYFLYKGGKGVYNWWNDKKDDEDGLSGRRYNDLSDRLRRLEREFKPAKDYSGMGWGRYFWEKSKGFAHGVGSMVPKIGGGVVSVIAISQASSIAARLLPNIGDYLFEGRTIAWCIETKTSLRRSIRDLAAWSDTIVDEENDAIALACLTLSMNIFVKEVEKVLGFACIIQDRLKPDMTREAKRAEVSVALIKKYVADLVRESNNRIVGKKPFDKPQFASFIKRTMVGIIGQMEKFEIVEQATGYDNLERLQTFDNLRAELNPEVKKLRAEKKEFDERLAKMRELGEELEMRNLAAAAA